MSASRFDGWKRIALLLLLPATGVWAQESVQAADEHNRISVFFGGGAELLQNGGSAVFNCTRFRKKRFGIAGQFRYASSRAATLPSDYIPASPGLISLGPRKKYPFDRVYQTSLHAVYRYGGSPRLRLGYAAEVGPAVLVVRSMRFSPQARTSSGGLVGPTTSNYAHAPQTTWALGVSGGARIEFLVAPMVGFALGGWGSLNARQGLAGIDLGVVLGQR